MGEITDVLHFIFLVDTQEFKSFASLSMRYASLRFRTPSLLDLMSASGISVMWSLVRKCSETVAGLEILEGLSTGLRGVRLNGL